ncbi:hypothetical protein GGP79_002968 [Salinibacter ruber]|uniref:hypothetical protein n=1 Tax=Salinibacter ruber TaxID=146919 RepID=UPI0021678FB2|nr:hypothetical protein [Salinibacter ruber]MCS3754987.1 hypothetical protein [Salinibacter ruber]
MRQLRRGDQRAQRPDAGSRWRYGEKGVPIYKRLPYLNGRRPEIVETGGSGSDSSRSGGSGDDISSSRSSGSEVIRIETEEGTTVGFDSTEEYLRFQEKRERRHPPS